MRVTDQGRQIGSEFGTTKLAWADDGISYRDNPRVRSPLRGLSATRKVMLVDVNS